jgi:hypothetical protein
VVVPEERYPEIFVKAFGSILFCGITNYMYQTSGRETFYAFIDVVVS